MSKLVDGLERETVSKACVSGRKPQQVKRKKEKKKVLRPPLSSNLSDRHEITSITEKHAPLIRGRTFEGQPPIRASSSPWCPYVLSFFSFFFGNRFFFFSFSSLLRRVLLQNMKRSSNAWRLPQETTRGLPCTRREGFAIYIEDKPWSVEKTTRTKRAFQPPHTFPEILEHWIGATNVGVPFRTLP